MKMLKISREIITTSLSISSVQIVIAILILFVVFTVNAATGRHENKEVLSADEVKFLGGWDGEVIFNNEYRYWYLTRKRDHTISYKFKICDVDQTTCKEVEDFGYWYADQNYYYALWPSDSDQPNDYVYKYNILDNECIHFGMISSAGDFEESKNPDDYIDKYKFQDCKVN